MSLLFLRPSPPPSSLYLRSFLRSSNCSSTSRILPSRRSKFSPLPSRTASSYSTDTASPTLSAAAASSPASKKAASTTRTATGPDASSSAAASIGSASEQTLISHPQPSTRTSISSTSTSASASSSSSKSSSSSSPSPSPPSPTPSIPYEPLPFHVHRTASQRLPVYQDRKAGGTLLQTIVRKVDGDREALRAKLLQHMPGHPLDDKDIKINRLNGHIVIKGHRGRDVAAVLRALHF